MSKIPEKGNIIVKFSAPWCAPCRALVPIMKEIQEEYKDSAEFLDLDIDENQELAASFGVRSIPFILFFKDGVVNGQLSGVQSKENITNVINLMVE